MLASLPARLAIALASLIALAIAAPAHAAVTLDRVGSFDTPTYVTSPPGDAQRLLVVQQGGAIKLVKDGVVKEQPFLRAAHVRNSGEQGLLSMAFDPGYASNGRFYVYYIRDDRCTSGNCDIQIDEYRRSSGNPDQADPKSARRVIVIGHRQHSNHNGGQLQFGPDGLLYIGTGDGGGAGDPQRNAQNRDSLLGKLLRIDPRKRKSKPYTVPSGNPFVGRTGRDEIWSYGLRNPFRFSFDRLSGNLFIGDVGQDKREEVDSQARGRGAGANYGWNVCEGTRQYPSDNLCTSPPPNYVGPIFDYSHDNGNCSITGGYVSRDTSVPETKGSYVYADFCVGDLRALSGGSGSIQDAGLGVHVDQPSSFGQDARCRLYVASLGGPVYRIASDAPGGSGCQS